MREGIDSSELFGQVPSRKEGCKKRQRETGNLGTTGQSLPHFQFFVIHFDEEMVTPLLGNVPSSA